MKRRIFGALLLSLLIVSLFAMTACDDIFPITPPDNGEIGDEYMELYEQYVEYVKSVGEVPVEYEEWITSLIEYDGEYIEPTEGENGNWWIGDVDTGVPICVHKMGDWIVISGATCTETGLERRDCDICNYYETLIIGTVPHNGGEAVIENMIPADCQSFGVYDEVVYCDDCGKELSRETFLGDELGGHILAINAAIAPTCTTTGLTEGEYCSICGEVTVEQTVVPELKHTPGEAFTENLTEATCTEDGYFYEVSYCVDCGAEASRAKIGISAKGHIEVVINGLDPTCCDTGLSDGKYCTVCGETTIPQIVIPKLDYHVGSTFEVIEIVTYPDCINSGLDATVTFCSTCNEEISRSYNTTDALGHPIGESYTVVENQIPASCLTEGSYESISYCGVCYEETARQTIVIPATGHTEAIDSGAEPGCEYEGLTNGSHCGVCGVTITAQQIIPAIGHSYEESFDKGDCKNYSVYTYACNNCGDSYEEIGDFGDHVFSSDVCSVCGCCAEDYFIFTENEDGTYSVSPNDISSLPAELTIPGVHNGKIVSVVSGFENCNSIVTLTIPSEVDTIAEFAFISCNSLSTVIIEDGVETIGSFAFAMGRDLTTVIIPESVSYVDEYAFTHNVLEGGYTPYESTIIYCAAEKEPYYWNSNWNNLGLTVVWGYEGGHRHNLSTLSVKEPNCLEGGYTLMGCDCGYTEKAYLTPITEHSYGDWRTVTPATCKEYGLEERICQVCEARDTYNPLPLDHNTVYGDYLGPTCTDPGHSSLYCTRCNEVLAPSEEIPPLGHSEIVFEGYEPTCTSYGHTAQTYCTTCKTYLDEGEYIDPLPHTEGEPDVDWYVYPDCVNPGFYRCYYYCSVCDSYLREERVDLNPLGHTEVIDAAIAPTCSATGLTEGKHCDVCDEVIIPQETIPMLEHTLVDWICVECGYESYDYLQFIPIDRFNCYIRANGDNIPAHIVVPETYNGMTVIAIGDNGFSAFENVTSLVSITLPDTIKQICDYAFEGCTNLTSVIWSDNFQPEYIGWGAFYGCISLNQDIIIPDSVTTLGGYAFSNSGITSVTIGDNSRLSRIEDNTFEYCASLAEVNIGEDANIEYIGICAFQHCTSLTSFHLPKTVTSMGHSVFNNCTALADAYVYDIDKWMAINLVEFDHELNHYGTTLHFIGENGKEITEIVIPESTTEIAKNTFLYAKNVTSFTVPDSVTYIGNCAFYGTGYYLNENNWEDGALYIGKHLIDAYAVLTESYTVKDGTLTIAESAFHNCQRLITATLPDSLVTIGAGAFAYCDSLRYVNIPYGITEIYPRTFLGCENLGMDTYTLEIPDSVTVIGESAFKFCRPLMYITIPDSVTYIGDHAFSSCNSLRVINLPDTLEYIGLEAFSGTAYQMDEYYMEDGVLYIGNHLIQISEEFEGTLIVKEGTVSIAKNASWYNRSGITAIVLPASLLHIGDEAFAYSQNLESIVFAENSNLISIGESAFLLCGKLKSLDIPASVTTIGKKAFLACTSLERVSFEKGSKLEGISDDMFGNCENITHIDMPENITYIGAWAFSGCLSIQSFVIPDSVAIVYENAFSGCLSLESLTIGKGIKYWAAMLYSYSTSVKDIYVRDVEAWLNVTMHENVAHPNRYEGTTLHFIDDNGNEITDIVIPESVAAIRDYAFMNAVNIKSVTLHDGITYIGDSAFNRCAIKNIELPKNVEYIGNYAFYNCPIESIDIPASVKYIGHHAFLCDDYTMTIANFQSASDWVLTYAWDKYKVTEIYAEDLMDPTWAAIYLSSHLVDYSWERK